MVRISEDLIRKRAEHNNCELFTLEEVSLHQSDIERLELIDKLCRDLKILYLQSNLIPKIENVGRLKKLEYLNLALNNITRVENLEGCESLNKLDFTVNFIGELTSIETLKNNIHLRELFLTGNPCTEYEGYREYVIVTLPQLRYLDGKEIEKSERIVAKQEYEQCRRAIIQQQREYEKKRQKQQEEEDAKANKKPGFDGRWYTDMDAHVDKSADDEDPIEEELDEDERERKRKEANERFWSEKTEHTPEARVRMHEHLEEQKREREEIDRKRIEKDPRNKKREIRFFGDDGKVLNINQGKLDFKLIDEEENNSLKLDLACYKHIDTSLIDIDVQPSYIRVVIKGKVFQLVLPEEVTPDSSTAQRSQTTGHLLVTMPKVRQVVRAMKVKNKQNGENKKHSQPESKTLGQNSKTREVLEIDPSVSSNMDFSSIFKEKQDRTLSKRTDTETKTEEQAVSEDFIDDPDVPPLI